jgi:hypothetical protein
MPVSMTKGFGLQRFVISISLSLVSTRFAATDSVGDRDVSWTPLGWTEREVACNLALFRDEPTVLTPNRQRWFPSGWIGGRALGVVYVQCTNGVRRVLLGTSDCCAIVDGSGATETAPPPHILLLRISLPWFT